MRTNRTPRQCILAVLMVILLLMTCGCDSLQSGQTYEQLADQRLEQLENTQRELTALLSGDYSVSIPKPAAYSAPLNENGVPVSSIDSVNAWQLEQQQRIFTPALEALLDAECARCLELMGEEYAETLNGTAQSIREQLAKAQSVTALYEYAVTMENLVFDSVAPEFSSENKDKFVMMPIFRTNSVGEVLLTVYSSMALPGFEDSERGYLLRLVLDGGDTELTIADSISNYENITCESSYAVTFNLSKILTNATAQDFFDGRNRVTFTLFALDNSFSSSYEYYKLRLDDSGAADLWQLRQSLAQIIADTV